MLIKLLLEPFSTIELWGLKAPGISWLGSLFIIATTLIVLVYMAARTMWVLQPLKKAEREIASLHRAKNILDNEALNSLDVIFSKSWPLEYAWREFRETLILEEVNASTTHIYNTRPAEEFFTQDGLVGQRLNVSFFTSFPGIVTGIGLLLTFLAIFVGLRDLNIDAQASQITGIDTLINSLAGKFLTSIIALTSATIYLFIEKPLFHRVEKRYQIFVNAINRLFVRRTVEHILEEISRGFDEQTAAFKHFGVDLSSRLKEGLTESLGPTLTRMVEVVERLAAQQRAEGSDAIKGMAGEFMQVLNATTGTQFTALQKGIEAAGRTLEGINTATEQSHAGMTGMVQRMGEVFQAQQLAVTREMTGLRDSLSSVLTQMKSTADMQQQQSHALLENVLGAFREAEERSKETVSSTLKSVIQKTSEWSESGAVNLRAAIDEHRAAAATLTEARGSLENAVDLFRSTLTQGRDSLAGVERSAAQLSESHRLVLSVANAVQQTQEKASQTSDNLSQQLTKLSELQNAQVAALDQFRTVFDTVDSGLGRMLSTLHENIETYSKMVGDYTGDHLTKFEDVFATAANELKSSSDMVREGLEQVSGPLEELAKKLQK